MTGIDEKYKRSYAMEFEDREVQKPLTYDIKNNSTNETINATLTPTPRNYRKRRNSVK